MIFKPNIGEFVSEEKLEEAIENRKKQAAKSKLLVSVSVKDTEVFTSMVRLARGLAEIISDCELSEANKEKYENIKADFFSLTREVES